MKFVRTKKKKKVVGGTGWVNINTGEVLEGPLGASVVYDIYTMEVVVKDMEFFSVAKKGLLKKGDRVSPKDYFKLSIMAETLKGPFCICMDENTNSPHTKETLGELLESPHTEIARLVKRMEKWNAIKYVMLEESGYKKKVYIINPQYFSTGRIFNFSVLREFNIKCD